MSELTHVNRVATVGQLSASIAHDQATSGRHFGNACGTLARKANVEEVREGPNGIVSDGSGGRHFTHLRAMFKHECRRRPYDINKVVLSVLTLAQIDLQKHEIELDAT